MENLTLHHRENILVVEDSPTQALKVRFILEAAGFNVTTAKTGLEALASLSGQTPDLILLDMNLPEMGGQEVALKVKADPYLSGIPIIFLTGQYRDSKDIIRGLEIGAQDYLVKPIDDELLVARLRSTLYSTRTQRELGQLVRRLLITTNQIGAQLGGLLDLNSLLEKVANAIDLNFEFPNVQIWLSEGEQLILKTSAGENAAELLAAHPYFSFADQNHIIKCFLSNKLLKIDSLQSKNNHPFINHPEIVAPLHVGGQTQGVLNIVYPIERTITKNDELVVQVMADLISVAMQNALLYEETDFKANHDVLTGLLNRRAIMEYLESEWVRSIRYNRNLTICIIDVNKFKEINDQYGHECGDKVLIALSNLFQNELRNSVDRVGRIGGDEFMFVLPETDFAGGKTVADRMSEKSSRLIIKSQTGDLLNTTISLGFASWPETAINDFDDLMHAADQAMYQTKAKSRMQNISKPLGEPFDA